VKGSLVISFVINSSKLFEAMGVFIGVKTASLGSSCSGMMDTNLLNLFLVASLSFGRTLSTADYKLVSALKKFEVAVLV
jgi:hypothetical protein